MTTTLAIPILLVIPAITAGILQALGYFIYIRQALMERVVPNATTWLMFAYGTILLTVLEFDLDGGWSILLLPVVCSICGIVVSIICRIKQGRWVSPEDWGDLTAFILDLFLSAIYFGTFILGFFGVIDTAEGTMAAIVILICANLSSFVSFTPNIRSVRRDPGREHWLPWTVWTLAYTSLLIATILNEGWNAQSWVFYIYPITCIGLHGTIAWYAAQDELSWIGGTKQSSLLN